MFFAPNMCIMYTMYNNTIQYNILQCSTRQHNAIQYNAMQNYSANATNFWRLFGINN